ncbi:MarC family protein [Lysobacter sp. GCM10012299]|uniref:MarC family protein n=1 Tax=Lysobacter sp. GCM10012299 TaxID=3317333 RepID=UPI00361C326F
MLQQAPHEAVYILTTANVMLLFFIMLGPVKILAPFYRATATMEPKAVRRMAIKVALISAATLLVAGLLGSAMMQKWRITVPVMELTGGIVFLLVALKQVLEQYGDPPPPPTDASESRLMHLVFPVVVTPYGIAALIALMALSTDASRSTTLLVGVMAVMAINLVAMMFVRQVMRGVGPLLLQIFGAVLAVQQVALALQLVVAALKGMGVA